jgi:hypothetical protein
MNPALNRPPRRMLPGFNDSAGRRFNFMAALFAAIFFTAAVRAQMPPLADGAAVHSLSGQFTITAMPGVSSLFRPPGLATNCLRLEPTLLAIAAENFKGSLWRRLGLDLSAGWSGEIFFELRPARTTSDEVTIASRFFVKAWDYQVAMPDVVTRLRYGRALASVLLLEIANRQNRDPLRSVEIPQWLAAGLGQEVLAADGATAALTAPAKSAGGILQSRVNESRHGIDAFAGARSALENYPALTFDELSWPSGAQLDGGDGGAYLACAQLFTTSLLALKDGPYKLRTFLALLPGYMNWQTAFFAAYQADFKRPLDVEKWWSLRLVSFTAHAPGPRWNLEGSRARFADLLAVPVEFRAATNSLPQHMTVTLQTAIRSFSSADCEAVVRVKLRDFAMAQFLMAAPFDSLAAGYRAVLADYLGEPGGARAVIHGRRGQTVRRSASVEATVKTLDFLDARRREIEARLNALPLPVISSGREN